MTLAPCPVPLGPLSVSIRVHPRPITISTPHLTTAPGRLLHPSAAAVADRDLVAFHDDRHLPLPLGVLEHIVELRGILLDVVILRCTTEGLTGLLGIRSAGLPVDDHLCPHVRPLRFAMVFPGTF